MDTIFGIPLDHLRITSTSVVDVPLDRRRKAKPTIPKGWVFFQAEDDGSMLWIRRELGFPAVRSDRQGREYANALVDALRPLTDEDIQDPSIKAQILDLVLDFRGVQAGHLSHMLIAMEHLIDIEGFLNRLTFPTLRKSREEIIRQATLESLRNA